MHCASESTRAPVTDERERPMPQVRQDRQLRLTRTRLLPPAAASCLPTVCLEASRHEVGAQRLEPPQRLLLWQRRRPRESLLPTSPLHQCHAFGLPLLPRFAIAVL